MIFLRTGTRPTLRKFSSGHAQRDPYEVLGLKRGSTTDEIKQRFRVLAKQFHPDLNRSPDASTKMAEIATAYDVLTDPEKRVTYDSSSGTTSGFSGFSSGDSSMFNEFASMFTKMNARGRATSSSSKGEDISATLEIDFIDTLLPSVRTVSIRCQASCGVCGGSGCQPGTAPSSCRACKGSGTQRIDRGIMTMGLPCSNCAGSGRVIDHLCSSCRGNGTKLTNKDVLVKTPAGIRNFQELRLPSQGHCGVRGGRAGDLYVTVKVRPHKKFRVIDEDVHQDVGISLKEALLGGEVGVELLGGGEMKISLVSKTMPGSQKILRGRGPPKTGGGCGDMVIHFFLEISENLTPRQRTIIQEFDEIEKEKIYV